VICIINRGAIRLAPEQEVLMSESPMRPVYAADTPMLELRTAELLVVASLRLWAAPYRDPDGTHADWRDGLAAAGVVEHAAPAFDALLQAIVASTRRSLDVRCKHCPHLGADEAWLLQLVSLLQRHRVTPAMAILADWLPATAARIALAPAQRFAMALGAGALIVPLRHVEAATAPAAGLDRGYALVQ
jgi:hypothetical protein